MTHHRRNRMGLVIGIAAALLITATAVFTPVGQAAVAGIRDLFAPEKVVEIEIEGEGSQGTYELHTTTPAPEATENTDGAKESSYALYVDTESYVMESKDGVDRITPINFNSELPEVSMEIRQDATKAPDVLATEIASQLADQYDSVYDAEAIENPFKAIRIMGVEERGKNDNPGFGMIEEVYLIDNAQGGSFIVTIKYFAEAAEGHGARMTAMLNEFTVVAN